jgi:hypothetical protein
MTRLNKTNPEKTLITLHVTDMSFMSIEGKRAGTREIRNPLHELIRNVD